MIVARQTQQGAGELWVVRAQGMNPCIVEDKEAGTEGQSLRSGEPSDISDK